MRWRQRGGWSGVNWSTECSVLWALASPSPKGSACRASSPALGLFAVVALSLFLAGCGSSSTGPQTTPSAYAGSYNGIVEGAGVSGTVAITVGQVSTDLTRGPQLHAEGGNPDAVTLTLATSSGSITLTAPISGNTATVTSTSRPPPAPSRSRRRERAAIAPRRRMAPFLSSPLSLSTASRPLSTAARSRPARSPRLIRMRRWARW